jgi:hypothetical protein|tara:strand:- start:5572 stop:5949 length:378 start_codon:yes stop_codon:yes gene_type:complete
MSMLDIKIVRLNSGEELIGEVKDDGANNWVIKNVCQIAASYADPTQATARIGLAPFMPYSKVKDGFTVSKTFVAFLVEPVNELLNEYNKVFGSGLVLPPSPAQQPFDGSKPQPVAPSDSHAFVKI